MNQIVLDDKYVVATQGPDGKFSYDKDIMKTAIKEMIAGQPGGSKSFTTSVKVIYRWDRNRKTNNDKIYNTWKINPVMKNRIRQLNALVFGRGFGYTYDDATKQIIDRFWRVNRIRLKLNSWCTDAQLFGELFIGLLPQKTGDVLMAVYESNQVDIDFDPTNINNVNKYIVSYRDEEKSKDEKLEFMPLETYLNNIEFTTGIVPTAVNKVRRALGLNGATGIKGKGVMVHVKFNNSTNDLHGTSDFKQVLPILEDYMNFVGDRLTIHQLYGSPSYDITIDTEDEDVIMNRIEELAGFTIGSNPVHNKNEEWKPLEFRYGGIEASDDNKTMRGLLCAGMGFPEHLLFNQGGDETNGENTFALNKTAEDMQDTFGEIFADIHKFAVAIAGGDPATVDEGQIIFPEISTMSEKTKAETYVLKVGANICSRETAAMNTGHDWAIELPKIQEEMTIFAPAVEDPDMAGAIGGRFTTRKNNQDPERDDGTDDREARAKARNVSTQVMGNRRTNN